MKDRASRIEGLAGLVTVVAQLLIVPSPAMADVPTPADEQLYATTIATMRDLPEPPFLSFVTKFTSNEVRQVTLIDYHGTLVFRVNVNGNEQPSASWETNWRASDDLASVANTPQSHLLSHAPHFNPTWIGVYDWIRYGPGGPPFFPTTSPQLSSTAGAQLKTIGMVTVLGPRAYQIRAANPALCLGGQAGRHLQLTTNFDVYSHPLMDVTIDVSTMRFCSMRLHSNVIGGGGVAFSEIHFGEVDRYWMMTSVDTDYHGHGQFGIGGHRAAWHIRYDDMRFPTKLDDAIFSLPADGSVAPSRSA